MSERWDRRPVCSLCGGPVEEWPGGGGFGHNPQPLAPFDKRCCDECNQTKVLPARFRPFEFDLPSDFGNEDDTS